MDKMENYYFVGMILFFCTTILYVSKYREAKEETIISLTAQEEVLIKQAEQQKRLRNYTLTAIKLNDICNKTRVTRLAKSKDQELQVLLKELN